MAQHSPLRRDSVIECPPGIAYDEQAFRFFAELERRRASRTGGDAVLLLASIGPDPTMPTRLSPASARRLIEALRRVVRDTDVIGWYRQDLVAGAVLDGGGIGPAPFGGRIAQSLAARLPKAMAAGLQVRLVRHDEAFDGQ